jgi:hypothetical protein
MLKSLNKVGAALVGSSGSSRSMIDTLLSLAIAERMFFKISSASASRQSWSTVDDGPERLNAPQGVD